MAQPPKIIFWLLLLATAAVDAVALTWVGGAPGPVLAYVFFDALVVGQLSVVSIRSALSPAKTLWAYLAPAAAAICAGVLLFPTVRHGAELLPYYALHVALLWAVLKVFERTPFWRRRSGSTADWRFSITQLLVTMTIVALLLVAARDSQYFAGEAAAVSAGFIACSIGIALASVVAWSLTRHWLQRLALSLGAALVAGLPWWLAEWLSEQGPFLGLYVTGHFLIQALVLSVWLGCWPIIPLRASFGVDVSPAPPGTAPPE